MIDDDCRFADAAKTEKKGEKTRQMDCPSSEKIALRIRSSKDRPSSLRFVRATASSGLQINGLTEDREH